MGLVADVFGVKFWVVNKRFAVKRVNGVSDPRLTPLQYFIWRTRKHFDGFNYSSQGKQLQYRMPPNTKAIESNCFVW